MGPLLWLALAAQATGQDPATEADLRCAAVFMAAAGAAPEAERAAVATGVFYYLGRIDARAPGYDYAASLERVLTDPAGLAQVASSAQGCVSEFQARAASLEQLGSEMESMARRRGGDPSD